MLGTKLMKLRRKQGLSQQEVADLLGVTRQTISNWECGQGAPALDKATELAELYHIGLADLVADEVEVMASSGASKKDIHVLRSLVGETCVIDFGDSFDDWDLALGSGSGVVLGSGTGPGLVLGSGLGTRMLVLDVNEDWLKVEYERSRGLNKKETVMQLIDVDAINGFTLVGSAS